MAKIQIDELLFECPICIEQFDESCKMLPCQHIFCQSCLEKIYNDADQHPDCPTCRQKVSTPLLELKRPILLLNLLEKVKAQEREPISPEPVVDELETAVELSIETYQKERDFESSASNQEVLQLQIALSKSEEEALFEAEKLSLITENEKLEYELTLMKSGSSGASRPLVVAGQESEQTHVVDLTNLDREVECASTKTGSSELPMNNASCVADANSEEENFFDATEISVTGRFKKLNTSDESKPVDIGLNIPEGLLSYLTSPNQELIMKQIVAVVSNVEKFNALQQRDLVNYIKTVDEYLEGLTSYRRNSVMSMHNGSGDTASNFSSVPQNVNSYGDLCSGDSNAGAPGSGVSDDEDRELAYVLELSRHYDICQNEDELLEMMLKKSEMLDVVDKLESQLFDIKEKLELKMAVLISEGLV